MKNANRHQSPPPFKGEKENLLHMFQKVEVWEQALFHPYLTSLSKVYHFIQLLTFEATAPKSRAALERAIVRYAGNDAVLANGLAVESVVESIKESDKEKKVKLGHP